MKDREKIIRYFAATSDDAKDMAIRLLDLADVVDRGRPFAVGPFMSPFAAQIGQTIATHMKTVTVKSEGGYHEAERVRIAFSRDDYDGPIDFGMTLLSVTWDDRYRLIGHRDVLGSLMGLGIDRAVLGDILGDGLLLVKRPILRVLGHSRLDGRGIGPGGASAGRASLDAAGRPIVHRVAD